MKKTTFLVLSQSKNYSEYFRGEDRLNKIYSLKALLLRTELHTCMKSANCIANVHVLVQNVFCPKTFSRCCRYLLANR